MAMKIPTRHAMIPAFKTPRTLAGAKKQIAELTRQLTMMEAERDQFATFAEPLIGLVTLVTEHAEEYADDAVSDHEMDGYAHKD